MHQVEVETVESKSGKALLARLQSRTVALVAVPDLAGHEDLVAREAARAKGPSYAALFP